MVRPTKLEAKLECTTAPAPTYVLLAHARPHNALHSPSNRCVRGVKGGGGGMFLASL